MADGREAAEFTSELLLKLHRTGQLQRVARGLYSLPDSEMTEHQSLVEVCRRVPKAVICLMSALQFHEIGTQFPREVWIALPEATQTPAIRVYSLAKTTTDCFKFRHKVGLDVALEALKEAWRQRKLDIDEVTRYAKINRVARVMQPYLEAVVARRQTSGPRFLPDMIREADSYGGLRVRLRPCCSPCCWTTWPCPRSGSIPSIPSSPRSSTR